MPKGSLCGPNVGPSGGATGAAVNPAQECCCGETHSQGWGKTDERQRLKKESVRPGRTGTTCIERTAVGRTQREYHNFTKVSHERQKSPLEGETPRRYHHKITFYQPPETSYPPTNKNPTEARGSLVRDEENKARKIEMKPSHATPYCSPPRLERPPLEVEEINFEWSWKFWLLLQNDYFTHWNGLQPGQKAFTF